MKMKTVCIGLRSLLFRDAVASRQGIPEEADFGGEKGEYDKQRGGGGEEGYGAARIFANFSPVFELACFIDIRCGRRDKENGDVDPIGGGAYYAVVGVKQ